MRLSLALKIRQRWICPGRMCTTGLSAPLTSSGVYCSMELSTGTV